MAIDDILHYKRIVKDDTSRIFVGGIMATLMADDLYKTTGIYPIKGLLNKPGMLNDDNEYIVEDMIPDYSLFDTSPKDDFLPFDDLELNHNSQVNYSLLDSYFGYSTRGCVRKCKFCGVPELEPEFIDYKGLKPYVAEIDKNYGEKQHLILFDNNILGSKKFKKIIHDILDLGFEKGAKRNNKQRIVDFNQGTDARLMKEKHFKLLSQIAINPLRIAFDEIKHKDMYCEKIRLAAKYEIQNLSNYILYNYKDTPEDLWNRLNINIDLNIEYGLDIYSFPMKYIPLNAKDRSHIDTKRWNWYFIRSVQRIVNVIKGPVMTGTKFFHRAFGENEEEFIRILHMPENILLYRGWQPKPLEMEWNRKFKDLTTNERNELLTILCKNRTRASLTEAISKTKDGRLKRILDLYQIDEEEGRAGVRLNKTNEKDALS
jgi:hypothetical protein